MSRDQDQNLNRRSVMAGVGIAVAGLAAGATAASAQNRGAGFTPVRDGADAWLGQLSGGHRVFIDSATAHGGAETVLYAANLYTAQEGPDYNGSPDDLAIVVCFRHFSTPFGYNDAMWRKYGSVFNTIMSFPDPATSQAPTANMLNQDRSDLPNFGVTIDTVREKGTHFAICRAATQFFSGQIAQATGGQQPAIFDELVANAIPNSRFVAAGVVALTRAQEYGYSLLAAG